MSINLMVGDLMEANTKNQVEDHAFVAIVVNRNLVTHRRQFVYV
jgi:hypothetical protein